MSTADFKILNLRVRCWRPDRSVHMIRMTRTIEKSACPPLTCVIYQFANVPLVLRSVSLPISLLSAVVFNGEPIHRLLKPTGRYAWANEADRSSIGSRSVTCCNEGSSPVALGRERPRCTINTCKNPGVMSEDHPPPAPVILGSSSETSGARRTILQAPWGCRITQ